MREVLCEAMGPAIGFSRYVTGGDLLETVH